MPDTKQRLHCRHFDYDGITERNSCLAGHDVIAEFCDGRRFGWFPKCPCIGQPDTPSRCRDRDFPTAAERAERDARMGRMLEAYAAVVAQLPAPETGIHAGTVPCPICGGNVAWFRASNGHRRGSCATADCLTFSE